MYRRPNALAVAIAALTLVACGPAFAEDKADDAKADTTEEITSAPQEVIASANFAASVEFCKELDPANAAGYDAVYKKGQQASGLGSAEALAHPEYEKLKSSTLASKRGQLKEPGNEDFAKTSCLAFLKQK